MLNKIMRLNATTIIVFALVFLVGISFSKVSSRKDSCLLGVNPHGDHLLLHSESDLSSTKSALISDSCKFLHIPSVKLLKQQRYLLGDGFHRHLVSLMKLSIPINIGQNISVESCQGMVLERLPSGVFADPFELQHYLHRGLLADAEVFGDTNVELPSALSNCSAVKVHVGLQQKQQLLQDILQLEMSAKVPLHARYPPLCRSGYSIIEFGAPELLIYCQQGKSTSNCSYITVHSDSELPQYENVIWQIPCGNEAHEIIVSVVTIFVVLCSAGLIIRSAICALQANDQKWRSI